MVSQNLTATLLLFTTFLFISRSISAIHFPHRLNATTKDLDFIRTSCNATQYPDLCFKSLAVYASAVQDSPARLTEIAIRVAISEAKSTVVFLSKFSGSADEVKNCVSYIGDAIDSMTDSLQTLRTITGGGNVAAAPSSAAPPSAAPPSAAPPSADMFSYQMDDVLTNMSAALTYEETCTDEYEEEEEEGDIKKTVCDRVNQLKRFSSNALALANSYANNGAP